EVAGGRAQRGRASASGQGVSGRLWELLWPVLTLTEIEVLMERKIGIIFGMENTFPPAVVEKINSMKADGVTADFVKVGGVKMAEPSGYRVIIDRISQDIPFYRAYLKNAALGGTIVINNPFWWTA